MNHAAAFLSKQPSGKRQRPARIDYVIDQQHRACRYLFDRPECTCNVARLHRAIGHQFLFGRFRGANKRGDEGNVKRTGQPRREIIPAPDGVARVSP